MLVIPWQICLVETDVPPGSCSSLHLVLSPRSRERLQRQGFFKVPQPREHLYQRLFSTRNDREVEYWKQPKADLNGQ